MPVFSHKNYFPIHLRRILCLTAVFLTAAQAAESQSKTLSQPATQREIDWDGSQLIELSGNWDFYWGVLLTSFDKRPTNIRAYSIPFLDSWHKKNAGETQLPFSGFGTYQLRIILPRKTGSHVVLRLPPADIAVRVFCNGKEIYANGLVGTSAETTEPREYKPVLRELESDDGVYDLTIQAANFDLPYFNFYVAPVIVSVDTAFKRQALSFLADAFVTTALFILAVSYLITGAKTKHRKCYYFLSLSCFSAVCYLLVNGEALLGQIGLSRLYIWKIHYLSRFLSFYFFFNYTVEFFRSNLTKNIKMTIHASAIIVSGIFIALTPAVLMRFHLFSLAIIFGIVLFSLIVSLNGILHRVRYSIVFFVSNVILILFIIFDLIGQSPGWPILFNGKASLGLLLFGLIHSFLLADMLDSHVHTIENLVKERTGELETVLRDQTRHARMGEMLNFIAHQWQQYLYTISIYTESLREGKVAEEKKTEIYAMLSEAIQSMFSTLKDFRGFLIPEKKREWFSVNDECEKVLALMKDLFLSREIVTSMETNGDTRVRGIKNELEQVVLNLLTNAVDILNTRSVQDPRIWVLSEGLPETVKVTVEDNGGGVPKKLRPALFERYKTQTKGGSGLGLYMSRRIVRERFHGDLFFEEGTAGARFVIMIPRDYRKSG